MFRCVSRTPAHEMTLSLSLFYWHMNLFSLGKRLYALPIHLICGSQIALWIVLLSSVWCTYTIILTYGMTMLRGMQEMVQLMLQSKYFSEHQRLFLVFNCSLILSHTQNLQLFNCEPVMLVAVLSYILHV